MSEFKVGQRVQMREYGVAEIIAIRPERAKSIIGIDPDGDVLEWFSDGMWKPNSDRSGFDLIAEKVDEMERLYLVLGSLANILEMDASHANSQTAVNREKVLAEAKAILAERSR